MSGISRREFVAKGAALGAVLPMAGPLPIGRPPQNDDAAPGPITVFTKHLQWLEYEELADVVAEAGFDGLDLTVRPGGHVLPERVDQDLPRAVRAAREAGLVVPMMTTAITRARHAETRRILGTAQDQGIEYYRMGYLRYPEDADVRDALERMRPLLRELGAVNEQYGIHGGYQNHSGTGVGAPVWDLDILLDGLDPRWIGVQYDIAHATVEGGRSWPVGLQLLAPHVRTMDIKDFVWSDRGERWVPRWVPVGEGMVDFPAYLRLVRSLRISGPISLHFEYSPLEGTNELPHAARRREAIGLMRRDLQKLRSLLQEADL